MKQVITDREWEEFVETGKVEDEILEIIATRIINWCELTEREIAIYDELNEQIEEIIINHDK